MNKIFDILLKAKHWQLFIGMFLVPLAVQVLMVQEFISSNSKQNFENPEQVFESFKYLWLFSAFAFLIGITWFISIGVRLRSFVSGLEQMKVKKFIFLSSFSFCYMFMASTLFEIIPNVSWMIFLIIPMHLTAMFGMLYMLYFPGRVLKSIELGRVASRGESIGSMFLFWFFPIGLWTIQPIANKVFAQYNTRNID
ncbi:MAG: hypothetical protein OCC49_01065 [Fibrobacterales bacterium]